MSKQAAPPSLEIEGGPESWKSPGPKDEGADPQNTRWVHANGPRGTSDEAHAQAKGPFPSHALGADPIRAHTHASFCPKKQAHPATLHHQSCCQRPTGDLPTTPVQPMPKYKGISIQRPVDYIGKTAPRPTSGRNQVCLPALHPKDLPRADRTERIAMRTSHEIWANRREHAQRHRTISPHVSGALPIEE